MMTSLLRQRTWIILLLIAAARILTPSLAHAQYSGPTVDACSSAIVDGSNDVEMTVCVYGNSSEIDATAETDFGYDSDGYTLGASPEVQIYDGNTLAADSGFNGDSCVSTDVTPTHLNDVYTVNGVLWELYDPSGSGDYGDAYWIDFGVAYSITAQITQSLTITSTSIPGAAVGSLGSFTVTGTNLVDSSGVSNVSISGGATASVASGATSTQETINYSIPLSAPFGPQTLTISNSLGSGTATFLFQQTPVITWLTPEPISAGTALSATQLDASASVPGTSFVYSPPSGTVLSAGSHTLSVLFTPEDTADYATATATTTLYVQDAPTINWPTPSAISYGTALSSTQLDATATYGGSSIPGTYEYTPAAGEVLDSGTQTLTVTFTPSDLTHYSVLTASVTLQVNASSTQPLLIYCYSIGAANSNCPAASPGYAFNGNLLSYTDSVMGTWSNLGYDGLNRLEGGSATSGYFSGLQMVWGYDSFGNRTGETFGGSPGVSMPTSTTAWYNANNQVSSASLMLGGPLPYDAAGDVTQDNQNAYLYDAEGRICAVTDLYTGAITGYVYDAEGNRVAKGTLASFNCGSTITPTNTYVIGPSNEQLTETDGNGNWIHTNVFAGGTLIATYDAGTNSPLHFNLSDWLGTRRVSTDYQGNITETCTSLPFGNDLSCNGPDPTEHHFTGKERDAESGNDYFGARYYASSMGRFLSPDPLLNSGRPDDPQSWNRYSYVSNNPLNRTDPTGLYTVGSCNADADTCKNMASNLKDDYWAIVNARFKAIEAGDMDAAVALGKSLDNLGAPGEKNAAGDTVTININANMEDFGNTNGGGTRNVTIDISPRAMKDIAGGADTMAHEGVHVSQKIAPVFTGLGWASPTSPAAYFEREWEPFMTQSYFLQYMPNQPKGEWSMYFDTRMGPIAEIWNSSWGKADIAANRRWGVWLAAHEDAAHAREEDTAK